MPLLTRLASVFRTLTRGSQLDADLDDELHAFVELLAEQKIQSGLGPEAARRTALLEVGGVEQVKEHVRDARFGQLVREMVTDLRSAWRQTRRDGGLSITLLVTIGLAIGVTATVFRIVHAVVLDPVPFHDPDRIVMLWATNGQAGIGLEQARRTASSVTAGEFICWRDQSGLFDALAAIALENNAHLGGTTVVSFADADANAEPARVALVSAGFFDVTGVRPRIGRSFKRSEIQDAKSSSLQTEPTVLLQEGYWRRRFDAREDVVGRTVWQGYGDGPEWSRQVVVAGVMPRDFAVVSRSVDYLQPLDIDERAARYPDSRDFVVMGRLRSGLSLEDAQRRSDAFARLLEARNAHGASGWHAVLVPVNEDVAGEFRPFMLALVAAVIVLVLVLAVNTATLLLLKTVARAREIGLRQALGAGSARLLRQFMTENMFLAAAGSGLGLVIANALLGWLRQHLPNPKTWGGSFLEGEVLRVDGTVVMFAVGSAVLVSVGFGLLPAWHASKSDVLEVLKDSGPTSTGGPKRRRIASALIATQFVLAAILATGSGLLVRSAMALHRQGPGFAHASRLVVGVRAGETQLRQLIVGKGRSVAEAGAAAASGTEPYWLARDDFRRNLLNRMAALPGVLGVTSASDAVMSGRYWLASFRPEGSDANECTNGLLTSVEPNYFAEMQIPRVEGRDFGPADHHGSTPVVIVSREVARRCWPGISALGRRLRNPHEADSPWFTVVGVVADTRLDGMEKAPLPHVYEPWSQNRWWWGQTSVILRTRGDPMQLVAPLRHELASMDKDAYVLGAHRLDDLVYDSAWRVNYAAQLSAGLAAVSLLLAAIGIYGVSSHTVRERTREIGLRMALGARARHVTILVLKSITIAAGTGLVSGLIASCFLTTSLRALLFGIDPFDAVTFAMTAVLLAATTLVAAAVPLWRALGLPPLVALRHGS